MIKGFKEFLLKNSVLALAIGFIMGAATGKVVSSLVAPPQTLPRLHPRTCKPPRLTSDLWNPGIGA